jgi:hypothetical protein
MVDYMKSTNTPQKGIISLSTKSILGDDIDQVPHAFIHCLCGHFTPLAATFNFLFCRLQEPLL